jgi:hypothetical protein
MTMSVWINRWSKRFAGPMARERRRVLDEVTQIHGFMETLMKERNRLGRWSPDEKRLLRKHLGRIWRMSPYLIVLALPGSVFLIPLVAWWLDRRRTQRNLGPTPSVTDRRGPDSGAV